MREQKGTPETSKIENTLKRGKWNPQRRQMLSRLKKRNTIRREAAGNAEFPSMRTLGESTDWAGTKGECVAGKGTSMGHWLSNTQEGKSCENVVLPANN